MRKEVEDKYPKDFYNHYDMLQFANRLSLGLELCKSAKNGNEESLKLLEDNDFFDSGAMMRMVWLMGEGGALKYFETKEGEKPGHFPMGFESYMFHTLGDYAVKIDPITLERNAHPDNLALQSYLGAKEFQRFEEFSIGKLGNFNQSILERLQEFTYDLFQTASMYFHEQGGLRRGLAA